MKRSNKDNIGIGKAAAKFNPMKQELADKLNALMPPGIECSSVNVGKGKYDKCILTLKEYDYPLISIETEIGNWSGDQVPDIKKWPRGLSIVDRKIPTIATSDFFLKVNKGNDFSPLSFFAAKSSWILDGIKKGHIVENRPRRSFAKKIGVSNAGFGGNSYKCIPFEVVKEQARLSLVKKSLLLDNEKDLVKFLLQDNWKDIMKRAEGPEWPKKLKRSLDILAEKVGLRK